MVLAGFGSLRAPYAQEGQQAANPEQDQAVEESATEQVVEPAQPEVVSGPLAPPPPAEVPTPAFSVLEEIEPNNLEPQAIPDNSDVHGLLSGATDQDLYQVYLGAQEQLFTLTLRHETFEVPSSALVFPVGWRVTLYGPTEKAPRAYELVFGARLDRQSASRSVGLNMGTYLIRVSPPFNIQITGFSKLPYTLEVRSGPIGNVRDIEPNDEIATRRGRSLGLDGTRYTGWLQQANDVDYYRVNIINLTSAGFEVANATIPYYLTVETSGTPSDSIYLDMIESRTCQTGKVSIFAEGDTVNPISSFCLVRGKKIQTVLYLDSGAYYIRIDRPAPIGDAYSYTIQLKQGSF